MQYSVLTPFLVPDAIASRKKLNLGDGFILRRIERALAPASAVWKFSSWMPLSPDDIGRINSTKALIIAGANQLQDSYTLAPKMTWSLYQSIKVPIIPFGVGGWGEAARTSGPTDLTRRILSDLHDRIEYSSWRCPQTLRYLNTYFPELAGKTLMTSCPVVFDVPLIDNDAWHSDAGPVAVTVTEREDFWDREIAILDFVRRRYPTQPRRLVLHQVFNSGTRLGRFLWRRRRTAADLHRYARKQGYEVIAPASVDDCWNVFSDCAMHVGSRLHAHLYFLSQAKRSRLVSVDDRGRGFAESLGFPTAPANELDAWDSFDYAGIRQRARLHAQSMNQFLSSCRVILAGPQLP